LRRKAEAGDAVGGGTWTGGLLITDYRKAQIYPIIVESNRQELRLSSRNIQGESKINCNIPANYNTYNGSDVGVLEN
jgi:hypothetical protein